MGETIDCREAKERLTDYLKQELTAELTVEVHEHLVRCRSCFGRAKFEETLVQLLEARARIMHGTGPRRGQHLDSIIGLLPRQG